MKANPKQRITENEESPSSSVKAYEVEKHLRHFCNSTSEELLTALGCLSGELEDAAGSNDANHWQKAFQKSAKSIERLMLLSRNLRYFAVHTRLDTLVTDFSALILNTLDLFEIEFRNRKILVAAFIESGLYLRVDPLAMGQVFFNLLKSASDSMPHGGKLTLSLSKNNTQLEICISDTGSGYAPKDIETFFEPYSLQRENLHPNANHQKLGLAVSKALIEAHGGDIKVRSTLGKGTNLILSFPYDPHIPKGESYLEKRRYKRIPITLPTDLSYDGESVKTLLTTLSAGGCFLKVENAIPPPPKDSLVSLRIHLEGETILEIPKARIVSHAEKGHCYGLGLEFTELSEKAKKVLSHIVKSHST